MFEVLRAKILLRARTESQRRKIKATIKGDSIDKKCLEALSKLTSKQSRQVEDWCKKVKIWR